ncbi:MAG: uracil phosphoribosyltransferase [Pseudomonadota bacterium]
MSANLIVIDHPLVQHKLTDMRRRETPTADFRRLLRETAHLLAYEVLRDLPLQKTPIHTPLEPMQSPTIEGKKLVLVSILRAGNGLLDGVLDLVPQARVGHVGLYRDPQTLVAVEYYLKVPSDIEDRPVIVVDPMLATANSASAAITRMKEVGARDIKFMCLLAAPEGVETLGQDHPDVPIYTAAVDDRLDHKGYIRPGMGDAGDRMYGTQ